MRRCERTDTICCAIDFPHRAAAASLEMGPETGDLAADIASNMIRLDRHFLEFVQTIFCIWTNTFCTLDKYNVAAFLEIRLMTGDLIADTEKGLIQM